MPVFTCVMNVRDHTRQTFVTSLPHEQICQVTQYEPNTNIQHNMWPNCKQFSYDSFSSSLNWRSSIYACRIVVESFYSPVRNIFPRISLHDLPCHRTMKRQCMSQVSLELLFLVIFHSSGSNPRFEHSSVIIRNILANLTFSLSATQINMVKKWCWFSQVNDFHEYFPHRIYVLFFPASLLSSTYTDRKSPFSRLTNKHSQTGTFSQPCFNRTFSNCRSHDSLARGWPHRFRSRRTTGSHILDHDFGHLCSSRRIQISGHVDFEIFNNVGASSRNLHPTVLQ